MPDREWVAHLASANRSRRCLDPGWERVARRGEIVIVRKGGLRLSVAATAVRSCGEALYIETPNEFLELSPGYYTAAGEAPFDMSEPMTRIYWNVRASGAAPLMRAATTLLNRSAIPFRLKVLANPRAFGRCDGGVLYVRRIDCAPVFEALGTIRRSVAPHLASRVPAFTKGIARGMAVAEEPGDGRSFGESRCALLASALMRGARSIEAIEATFARADIPLHRSFLHPGSEDIYPSVD